MRKCLAWPIIAEWLFKIPTSLFWKLPERICFKMFIAATFFWEPIARIPSVKYLKSTEALQIEICKLPCSLATSAGLSSRSDTLAKLFHFRHHLPCCLGCIVCKAIYHTTESKPGYSKWPSSTPKENPGPWIKDREGLAWELNLPSLLTPRGLSGLEQVTSRICPQFLMGTWDFFDAGNRLRSTPFPLRTGRFLPK